MEGAHIGAKVTVVDAGKARMYARNFGEFFNDQVANADLIVMSRTDTAKPEKTLEATEILKALNAEAGLITTPWDQLSGEQIREAMDKNGLKHELEEMEHEHHHHHDEEECDDPECECHHHHDDDDDDGHEHHHHHHDHDDDDDGHEHHHHHHHEDGEECDDPECECHHHHDDDDHEHHHHHHHADEIFQSWGMETPKKFTEEGLRAMLAQLDDAERFGAVLRAKGIVDSADGQWIYFDYVPGEIDLRRGQAAVTGRFCVIGSHINENALKELFKLG